MSSIFDERLEVNEATAGTLLYSEHLVRYQLAASYAEGKTVLDAACGSGYGAYLLATSGASKVWAVDADQTALAQAAKRYSHEAIEFLTDNVQSLAKIGEAEVDLVVSLETIEHLTDSGSFLQQVKRVLKPGGLAIISTPNRQVFGQKNPYHLKEYNRAEFAAQLNKYFNQVIILEQYNGLASVIDVGAAKTAAAATKAGEALYFIALASDAEIVKPTQNFISLNEPALVKWQKNVAWRLANGLYGILSRAGIFKNKK